MESAATNGDKLRSVIFVNPAFYIIISNSFLDTIECIILENLDALKRIGSQNHFISIQ
ncbi:hypothetical protein TCA2_2688 [Paenibacillus sp. TCA20]|nr:hypothetical protein TCA2_2688 [Paenibacillus sp. TCA20]